MLTAVVIAISAQTRWTKLQEHIMKSKWTACASQDIMRLPVKRLKALLEMDLGRAKMVCSGLECTMVFAIVLLTKVHKVG